MFLGVDTGGTFTDFVLFDGQSIQVHKVLSTPDSPDRAILQGIQELGLTSLIKEGKIILVHGSTVATNAALEGKGVRTAYITNHGFKDTLSIGRQTRKELYNLTPSEQAPPVSKALCLETGGRLDANGEVFDPLTEADVEEIKAQLKTLNPEAVAINFLFSFLDDRHEKALEEAIKDDYYVSRSSYVLPEYREYERGMATWLNAWLGPLVSNYLTQLSDNVAPTPLSIMQSSGGTIDASQAANRAVNLLLSGPAGGLAAVRALAKDINEERLLTFDMGGTSTDVAVIDGDIRLTNDGHIGDYPVAVPMVDMHTIGAGGGSIAYIDQGGLLQVGPESAGAFPGPACYDRGGEQPTVTDANTVLGRLRPEAFLGKQMTLDLEKARQAVSTLAEPLGLTVEQAALGILTIANEHMTRALRNIAVKRGEDPRAFRLTCFGGAGGLHVCDIAESLNIKSALVPRLGGVLSAYGMLVAPHERQLSKTVNQDSSSLNWDKLTETIDILAEQGKSQLLSEGVQQNQLEQHISADLRYQGQSFTINLPIGPKESIIERFHQAHQARFGHSMEMNVELVTLRVRVFAFTHSISMPLLTSAEEGTKSTPKTPAPDGLVDLYQLSDKVPRYQRDTLAAGCIISGPALISEQVSTTLIKPGWTATVSKHGHLLLEQH
ncbi:hydantoinase/oxoprolinase family protein [Litoribrevibacter euphylliae]|uniref:Hydantoinase/oxoprolinase family protein n=1 Tax=Litoribrevibacter euphylliae TaxID=1834034 RepID=A0ABV7HIU6_9GAMM